MWQALSRTVQESRCFEVGRQVLPGVARRSEADFLIWIAVSGSDTVRPCIDRKTSQRVLLSRSE